MADNRLNPIIRLRQRPPETLELDDLSTLGVPSERIPPALVTELGDVANINAVVSAMSATTLAWLRVRDGGTLLRISFDASVGGFIFKRHLNAILIVRAL